MMFSLEMISDGLAQFSCRLHSIRKTERFFQAVRSWKLHRESLTIDNAYFVNLHSDGNCFSSSPSFDYILCGDIDPCLAGANYLFIEVAANKADEVFEAVRDILDRYMKDFYWKLQGCALENGDLDELLDVAYPFFQNPMYVADSAFVLLAYSKKARVENPTPQWTSLTQEGILGADIVSKIKTTSISDLDKLHKASFMHPVDSQDIRNIVTHIEKNGVRIANVTIIESEHPLKQYHLYLTDYLATCVNSIIDNTFNRRKLAGTLYEKWLKMLFDGETVSSRSIESHLKNMRWKVDDIYQVGVIDFLEKPKTGTESLEYYWRQLTPVIFGHKSFLYQGTITALFHYRPMDFSKVLESNALKKVVSQGALRCGISRPFNDITRARIYREQAAKARKYATKEIPLVDYGDIMVDDLLGNPAFNENWRDNIDPGIASILETDISCGTNDVELLYHYLLLDRSLTKCADKINVHKNTVAYRVNRIRNKFHFDFNDPQVKMNLLLSCGTVLLHKPRN